MCINNLHQVQISRVIKNSPYNVVALENIRVKNLFPNDSDEQDLFYLDSKTDMYKLYSYYEKDTE